MVPFNRILVGLDLTETDFKIISFMCQFLRVNRKVEHIYFVHISKNLEKTQSEAYGCELSDEPTDEIIVQKMKSEVAKCLQMRQDVNLHFEVIEGDPLKQLLHWAKVKHIDLIVAGKKRHIDGKGIVMEKLARRSNCSVLFVTEKYKSSFSRILVPVDFSQRTDYAFDKVRIISEYLPEAKFVCLHVVDIPGGYTRIGRTYEEYSDKLVFHAKKNWQAYYKKNKLSNLKLEPVFLKNPGQKVSKVIFDYAHDHQIDLIMMGSKKQTTTAVFLLGSVAEQIITYDYEIPLLLLKQPGEIYDFQKAIEVI